VYLPPPGNMSRNYLRNSWQPYTEPTLQLGNCGPRGREEPHKWSGGAPQVVGRGPTRGREGPHKWPGGAPQVAGRSPTSGREEPHKWPGGAPQVDGWCPTSGRVVPHKWPGGAPQVTGRSPTSGREGHNNIKHIKVQLFLLLNTDLFELKQFTIIKMCFSLTFLLGS
jgi:hypothetical protein